MDEEAGSAGADMGRGNSENIGSMYGTSGRRIAPGTGGDCGHDESDAQRTKGVQIWGVEYTLLTFFNRLKNIARYWTKIFV